MDIHGGKCLLYGPHSVMVRTNPDPNHIPNPILHVATVERTFTFTAMLTTGMPLTALS